MPLIHYTAKPIWASMSGSVLFITAQSLTPDSYSHVVNAFGGYWSASMSFVVSETDMNDWMENGIGRHVEVYGDKLNKIWEGLGTS